MKKRVVFPLFFCVFMAGCMSGIRNSWTDILNIDPKKSAYDSFIKTCAGISFADMDDKKVYLENPEVGNEWIGFKQSSMKGKGKLTEFILKFDGLGDPGVASASDSAVYVELHDLNNKYLFYFWHNGGGKYDNLKDAINAAAVFTDSMYALIHNPQLRGYSAKKEEFKKIAKEYRLDPKKYKMTDEVRKFFVQAYFKDDDYNGAVILYNRGLAEAPWYPMGHYDLAMLLGERIGDYNGAVDEMNDFLELSPEADNAGTAREKIHEWKKKARK